GRGGACRKASRPDPCSRSECGRGRETRPEIPGSRRRPDGRSAGLHRRRNGLGLGPLECGTCSARSWTSRECLPEPDPDTPPVPLRWSCCFIDDRRAGEAGKPLRRNGQGMTDTNKPGDKTITVAPPSKTLTLSGKPGGPTTVRQNFSHGRSKPVVVEVAKKRT